MKNQLTRRDFLKLAGLLPLSLAAPSTASKLRATGNGQNVLIVIFDALSASNMDLHGYARETMPNLARLSERAVVYHNHYAGGNFTTPGTASLLTGTLPWTHRAIQNNGRTEGSFRDKNIFSAFADYHRLTYSHNPWVYTLLDQFNRDLDELIPLEELLLLSQDLIPTLFPNDRDIASVSWIRALNRGQEGHAYSLFFSRLNELYQGYRRDQLGDLDQVYPRGIPSMDYVNYFLLEEAVDHLGKVLQDSPQPFLGYLHFWPPHEPYRTHRQFYGQFEGDVFRPPTKPFNPFSQDRTRKDPLRLPELRQAYDEFILYADREFGRLYDTLERSGQLENTWVVLTSDHGEMFERGIEGHSTPVLYQPLIRIPLLIFAPGSRTRTDIYSPTSAIDLLPTLTRVTGKGGASWSEGIVMPPFSITESDEERSLYTLEARTNEQYAPLSRGTATLHKGGYKLIYYFGYEEWPDQGKHAELYDLRDDPEELNDLAPTRTELRRELLNELEEKIKAADAPYEGSAG